MSTISGTSSDKTPGRTSSLITHALLAATLIVAVTHSLAVIFQWGGPSWTLVRGDLMNLPFSLFAALLCWAVSAKLEGHQRLAWRFFAAGMTSFFLGDLTWALLEMLFKLPPLPSIAGAFYIGLPILFLFGLKTLTTGSANTGFQNRLEMLKISLDATLIVVATVIIAWQVFLAELISTTKDPFSVIFGTAMPSLELIVVVVLLMPGLGRRNAQPGPHFGLLWIGMILVLLGDSSLIVDGMRETYLTGQYSDLFYTWGFAAFALAAHAKLHFQMPEVKTSSSAQLRQLTSLFPYTAAIIGMVAMAQQFGHNDLRALGVLIGNGLLGFLVMCRQAISLHENRSLNTQLLDLNAGLTERVTDRELALEHSKERLIAADRLASLGQLTGGIAHEVNTPLAAAMNFLHQANALSDEYRNSINTPSVTKEDHLEIANELKGNIGSAQTTLERLGEFVRSIRNQGRSFGAGATSFNLVSVVRETVGLLEFEARKVNVCVTFESASDDMTIHGEPGRIAQIVQNLVGNAIHACESRRGSEGSQVTVRLSRRLTGQTEGMGVPVLSERVLLSVEDNGSGIPAEVLPRIFEPLYSTKEIGRGTGLGLSIIKDIITGHLGGEITLETNVGQGTTFTVSFPVAHAPQIELAGVRNFEPSRNTVIVGDD
jgi:signal transduction histidine kinase